MYSKGRIPEVTKPFIEIIRQSRGDSVNISLEIEKPGRQGLEEMALLCTYVFYSKTWAQSAGYNSLSDFLRGRRDRLLAQDLKPFTKVVFCTWGEEGSGAVRIESGAEIMYGRAVLPQNSTIVDTVGAGDVFIGSMLAQLVRDKFNNGAQDIEKYLKEANMLCGIKICQEGFEGLVGKMK
jgi:ketohexokinase